MCLLAAKVASGLSPIPFTLLSPYVSSVEDCEFCGLWIRQNEFMHTMQILTSRYISAVTSYLFLKSEMKNKVRKLNTVRF